MPESSVDSYIAAQPEQAMSWDEFYGNYVGNPNASADHWTTKLGNFFTGQRDRAKNEYEAYLNNLNNRNEFLASQSARAWDKMMDDSKYQRMMQDFEKAGLNPYLLVNNGGISASSAPSGSKASYNVKKQEKDRSDNGRNFALILLAVAKIAAAFL